MVVRGAASVCRYGDGGVDVDSAVVRTSHWQCTVLCEDGWCQCVDAAYDCAGERVDLHCVGRSGTVKRANRGTDDFRYREYESVG